MKNRTIILILITMSIICISIGILTNILIPPSNKQQSEVELKPVVVETPKLYGSASLVGDFEFNDISITKIGKVYDVFINVINNGEKLFNTKVVEIILYDSNNKELSCLNAELVDIEAKEEFQLILSTSDDISTVAYFKVEFKN